MPMRRSISASHYYVYETYSGYLEGRPLHEDIYKIIQRQATKMWGDRALHILKMDSETLPRWTHIAWLYGPEKDPENDGAELVVAWFRSDPLLDISGILNEIDWEKLAKDYQI